MHSNVAAMSVAVDKRVFCPASLVWANTATSNHLLHVTLREPVARRQTTLAGDHLWRNRTCGGIRHLDIQNPSPKTPLAPRLKHFRSHSVEMSCFRCVSSLWTRYYFTKTSTSRRDVEEKRGDFVENRKCVMTLAAFVCVSPDRKQKTDVIWSPRKKFHFESTWLICF